MTKRTISWLLCLMMVVSLFAGTLTSASAANTGVTIDPPTAVIYQTGDAAFTVSTVLDSLLDRIGSDKNFDLDDLVKSLKSEGLNIDTLTDMLSDAGFNWDDIIGSLNGGGFSMDDIAGALLDRLESGDLPLDESTLSDLLKALDNSGFDMDKIWNLIGGNTGSSGGISDLIGDLIGRFGRNGTGAKVLADADEPEDNGGVTTVISENLKEKLKEKYGDLFNEKKEKELDDLFASIEDAAGKLSIADAVNALINNENFNLNDTVDVIMDATNGEADYNELVNALKESTGTDLDMDSVANAFSDALGDKIDWSNLAEALENNLANGFDTKDFLDAIGSDDTDLSGIADKVSEALGMDPGSIDAEAVKEALNEALKSENGFDPEAFAAAMGEGFDSDAFLQSVADKLSDTEGAIDADAVSQAIEAALGEQATPSDLSELAKALKDAMGEDFSVEKLTEALTDALKGEDGEAPSVDSIVSAVTDAMGGELTNDQITELVKGLSDNLGENLDVNELVGSLADVLGSDLEVSKLLDSLKEVLGDDFDGNLSDIVSGLLGEGADLSEVINALKDLDFSSGDIADTLFGNEITYQWYSRDGRLRKPITSNLDSNIYSGEQTRTLSVSRKTAPVKDEVYTYCCSVTIGSKDQESISPDAVLTIKAQAESTPTDTKPADTKPTTPQATQPTGPVLDNVTHTAYIGGYEDGTVHPDSNITRAEVATIIYRLLTEETRTYYFTKANTFSDVASNDWFNEPVSTLARASVLNGYEDGTFHPNSFITRAELATILTRLTVKEPTKNAATPVSFSDLVGHWAAANIRTAAANGWVNGYEDGTFRPNQNVTRAEAVTMVNRMLGRNPQILTNTAGMRTFSDNANTSAWYYIQIQEAANGHDYVRDSNGHEVWTGIKK